MRTSEAIGQIAKAMAAAQAEMGHASKDAQNPHFRSTYATLASVVDAVRPALAKHGIAVLQGIECQDNHVRCTTRLAHESGEWIESTITMLSKDAGPQGLASASTYARRYGLAGLTGIAPHDDDDGEAAEGRKGGENRKAPPPPTRSTRPPPELPHSGEGLTCPACGSAVEDHREEHAKNSKRPAWKCSNAECTGGKDGKWPWASWSKSHFDPPPGPPPFDPNDDVPF